MWHLLWIPLVFGAGMLAGVIVLFWGPNKHKEIATRPRPFDDIEPWDHM